MRKNYLLLMLFSLATMFESNNVFAADPPQSEYEAALTAITDGEYYLVTEVGGTKWYVTQNGNLTDDKEKAYLFAISKVDASSDVYKLFDTAFLIDPRNGAHFSNATPLLDGNAYLHLGFFYQDSGNNRNDWERQVLYLKDGKFAIRTSNTLYGETSWLDAGRVFWTWEPGETDGSIIPCYSYEPAYIWTLELSSSPIPFADPNVKAICVTNWDANSDGELSYAEAAAVTDLGEVFKSNQTITSFDELQYFTGLTSIGKDAFRGCSGLTSITIPNNVTIIGRWAFCNCSGLTFIIIPASVTTMGDDTFNGCTGLTSIAIPEGITSIGNYAFWGCSSLTSITIPEGVTNIGENAFCGCKGLTSITLPNSMTSIGVNAFTSCNGLTSITIPNSVTSIGADAFKYCTGLASIVVEEGNAVYDSRDGCKALIETASNTLITGCNNSVIPEGITSIGNYAFTYCKGLTSIAIPNSLTSIGNGAFNNCTGLASIDIPNSVTSIGNGAFAWCSSLTSVTIPISVTTIDNGAFYGCSSLTSITIPNSLTTIGEDVFRGCNGLVNVTSEIEEPFAFGDNAFYNISDDCVLIVPAGTRDAYIAAGWTEDIFKGGIMDMGQSIAFEDANVKAICVANWDTNSDDELSYAEAAAVTDLGEVFQSNHTITSFDELRYFTSLENICNSAFGGCSGLASITLGNSVTSIGDYAFVNCSSLSSITIPKSVVSIGDIAFDNCSGLSSITIPKRVISIGYIAFRGCTGLTSINVEAGNTKYDSRDNSNAIIETESNTLITGCQNTLIPNNVTTIGECAFYGCAGLTSITIPNSVTCVGSSAFSGCSGLTSIEIPNSVTYIGSYAFYGCSDLTSIEIPNSVTYIGSYAFKNSGWYDAQSDGILYLDNWLICYKGINPTGAITIKNGTKGLASYAFSGNFSQTSIEIPNSVTFIGDGVFCGLSKLTSITIPNGVASIGSCLFCDCFGLTSVSIPNSVTSIGNQAFENCKSMTSITIPNGVTSIGYQAFTNCSGLTSITIPNHVTSIGYWAFNGCSGLTSFEIPNSVTSIGDSAFGNCYFATSDFVNNSSLTSSDTWGATLCDEETSDGLLIKNNSVIKCRPWVTSATIPDNVTSIGKSAFSSCSDLTSITIPNSVTSIGESAFSGCSGLISITIPNNVTNISRSAFSGCSGLISITIPNNVTNISRSAFCYCTGLTSITIPNSVTSIGYQAFSNCTGLTGITIPNSVTSIGNYAFSECTSLSSVISEIEEPYTFGNYAFDNISDNCVLTVPVGTRDAYIAAGWTEDVFKGGVVEMPEEDTDISGMDNVIYIEPTEGREGDIVPLEVKLKNSITPVGCSFKLKLPEGFSLVKDSDGDVIYELSGRTKKMSVTMQDWNNGSYDFALTPSTGTATISGNDGAIVTFRIQVPEEIAPGDYKIKLTNNLIQSKVSGTTQDNALPDIKTTFTVEDYIMGDVNGDKNVTPADAIMILYHYFNVEQNGFIVKAADLNKDGNITPADAIEALYLYFGVGNSNAVRSFIETLDPQ